MSFPDTQFAFFFSAVAISLVMIRRRDWQQLLLLGASCYFYATWSLPLILLLVYSVLLNFYVAQWMSRTSTQSARRGWLSIMIVGNLGLLAFFKYANFTIENINEIATALGGASLVAPLRLVLPVGISFYTFQAISYAVDVYRAGLAPERSLVRFGLYLTFFPKLIAGPIPRAGDFLAQLNRPLRLNPDDFKQGLSQFLVGLVKKLVFADTLAIFVNDIYGSVFTYSSVPVIMAALAYAVQIYCDFSGYSDMAIGSARILGLRLPLNFDRPYLSGNPITFWRRWHISLSSWLRDYLYIPLGGNRRGPGRTYFNLMTTMVLGGLWHGASWNFVVWGAYHGALQVLHRLFHTLLSRSAVLQRAWSEFTRSLVGPIITVLGFNYLVIIGWIMFRVTDFQEMAYVLQKFVIFDGLSSYSYGVTLATALAVTATIAVFVGLELLSHWLGGVDRWLGRLSLLRWTVAVMLIVAGLLMFRASGTPEFIYAQF